MSGALWWSYGEGAFYCERGIPVGGVSYERGTPVGGEECGGRRGDGAGAQF